MNKLISALLPRHILNFLLLLLPSFILLQLTKKIFYFAFATINFIIRLYIFYIQLYIIIYIINNLYIIPFPELIIVFLLLLNTISIHNIRIYNQAFERYILKDCRSINGQKLRPK